MGPHSSVAFEIEILFGLDSFLGLIVIYLINILFYFVNLLSKNKTSDAATIADELEVQHPVAKILVLAGKAQREEIGDRATP